MKLLLVTDTGERVEVRCDGCRHWDRDGDEQGEWVDWDADNRRIGVGSERKCKRVVRLGSDHANDENPSETVGAYTQDASGYRADLWTFGTYGCALFERKDPK